MQMMLTQWREIVEKVAEAEDLNHSLNILVNEVCLAMGVDVCSIYLANSHRRCYYLMATRGLKKNSDNTIVLAFDEGIVGLVGHLAKPVNLVDAQKHPSFKYIPAVKEELFHAFLGVPIIHRCQLHGVLVVQQREPRQFDEKEESFLVTLASQFAVLLSHSHLRVSPFQQTRIRALAAVPGMAMAQGWVETSQPSLDQVVAASTLDRRRERERLLLAMEETADEFHRFSKRFTAGAQRESAAIFDFYLHLLDDVQLKKDLLAEIDANAVAEWAVKRIIERFVFKFNRLQDHYLRQRAGDLRVLGQRLLFHLVDNPQNDNTLPPQFVLVTNELTAMALAELPQHRIAGIVVRDGAANSHAAILVRAMGIPTVMGADIQPELLNKRLLIVDGYRGELLIEPEPIVLQEYQHLISEEKQLSKIADDLIEQQGRLKSGEQIQVMLNAGLSAEHERAVGSWVDGIGLYRTEIPFMLHGGPSSEEELVTQYQEILQLFLNKPVTLRTLDIGADKQLPFLPISEENPCLGWRGIRLMLDQPDMFLIQIRAMLRANAATGNLNILLPMITSIDEIDQAKSLIERAKYEVEMKLEYAIPQPRLGIMLEVPSMLFMIPHLAGRIDFISVGTNDLTQYLLAVDRNNARVANLFDSLHPALLNALYNIVIQAKYAEIELCLCGEMAGDPVSVILLIGLGYRHLSMNGRNVARIKYLLRHIERQEAENLAQKSLLMQSAVQVRQHVVAFMEQRDLGRSYQGGF